MQYGSVFIGFWWFVVFCLLTNLLTFSRVTSFDDSRSGKSARPPTSMWRVYRSGWCDDSNTFARTDAGKFASDGVRLNGAGWALCSRNGLSSPGVKL